MRETICVSGTKIHVEQLAAALQKRQMEGIAVSAPRATKGTLFGRAPLGQFGLFEILISVASSMVSSAAYDGIKRIIAGFSKDGRVEVVTTAPKSEPKPNFARAKGKFAKSQAPKMKTEEMIQPVSLLLRRALGTAVFDFAYDPYTLVVKFPKLGAQYRFERFLSTAQLSCTKTRIGYSIMEPRLARFFHSYTFRRL